MYIFVCIIVYTQYTVYEGSNDRIRGTSIKGNFCIVIGKKKRFLYNISTQVDTFEKKIILSILFPFISKIQFNVL